MACLQPYLHLTTAVASAGVALVRPEQWDHPGL